MTPAGKNTTSFLANGSGEGALWAAFTGPHLPRWKEARYRSPCASGRFRSAFGILPVPSSFATSKSRPASLVHSHADYSRWLAYAVTPNARENWLTPIGEPQSRVETELGSALTTVKEVPERSHSGGSIMWCRKWGWGSVCPVQRRQSLLRPTILIWR